MTQKKGNLLPLTCSNRDEVPHPAAVPILSSLFTFHRVQGPQPLAVATAAQY
jgi:hypothetical protein